MRIQPSPIGPNGRDDRGRFTHGNPGGPGHPLAGAVSKLRAALIGAVSVDDMKAITRGLVDRAKGGDVEALRVLLPYLLGRPIEADLLERIETLEQRLENATDEKHELTY